MIALAGLFYTIRQKTLKGPVVIAGQEVPPAFMYSLAIIVVSPLLYLGDTSGVIGWVFGTSVFMIFLHAILYISEEIPGAGISIIVKALSLFAYFRVRGGYNRLNVLPMLKTQYSVCEPLSTNSTVE